MIIYLNDVRYGENKYWLKIKCFNRDIDINKEFIISFCGTEVKHNMSIAPEDEKILTDKLKLIFGYAPFDLKEAKEKLGKNRNITIE